MSFREPNVNLGVGTGANSPPHLVGEALLRHYGFKPDSREAHAFSHLDFCAGGEEIRKDGRLRASGRRW